MSDAGNTEAEGHAMPRPSELEDRLDEIVESGPIEQGRGEGHPRVQTEPGGPVESQPGATSGSANAAAPGQESEEGRSGEWPGTGGSGAS